MPSEIELWSRVIGDEVLLKRAASTDAADVAGIAALRKTYDSQSVTIALSLTTARDKAAQKFGERGRSMAADIPGVEQASSAAAAAYKTRRIAEAIGHDQPVADLCCGIGGDSMAMIDAGLEVLAVDRSALRAWMARHNTGGKANAVCADVSRLALAGMPIHLDPARRSEATGRRAWKLADYQPGPDFIEKCINTSPACVIKLSPGIDLDELPWPGEIEFISESGRLVQALLWTGNFRSVPRRATLIDNGSHHTLTGEPAYPPIETPRRYLFTFDPAIERAGLVSQLCEKLDAPIIHARLGLLTSDRILDSPWVTGFELIEQLPWRPKRVKQWLRANDAAIVEVKTRDKACDPDREQRQLRSDGSTPYTVFVLRFDTKVKALITRRLS